MKTGQRWRARVKATGSLRTVTAGGAMKKGKGARVRTETETKKEK